MFQQLGNCYCSCYHKFSFHIVCRHTGYTCAGFSKRSTRLLHWSFNAPLVHYPGLTLFWDGFAILTPIALVMNMVCHCLKHEQSCLKEKLMNQMEFVFLLLLFAGVVPLLCLASHTHYIFIAAITDPFYAIGIGIYWFVSLWFSWSLFVTRYW